MQYLCEKCGWVYDEASGVEELRIAPGVRFEELPDTFTCPLCGMEKHGFTPLADES